MYLKSININAYDIIESSLMPYSRIMVNDQKRVIYVNNLYQIILATEPDFNEALDECFHIAMSKVMDGVRKNIEFAPFWQKWDSVVDERKQKLFRYFDGVEFNSKLQ